MPAYEYRHQVAFEETNLLGNVYYVNHVRWQGRCREMFLCEHAPRILDDIAAGLSLVTVRCACDYLQELAAFDLIAIRMRLGARAQNRMTLSFEYWRLRADGREDLVARGEQQIAFMRRDGETMVAAPIPEHLLAALQPFA
jgi:enediyne biosynthesis thioesterase